MNPLPLYRPTLHFLIPIGMFTIAAAFVLTLALRLQSWPLLFLSGLLAVVALLVGFRGTSKQYEIYPSLVRHNKRHPPILIWHSGLLAHIEHHIPLDDLVRLTVRRPLLWSWCDGAKITLYFANGDVFTMGLVGNASVGISLLHSALPAR
jgi:hypothetical protein